MNRNEINERQKRQALILIVNVVATSYASILSTIFKYSSYKTAGTSTVVTLFFCITLGNGPSSFSAIFSCEVWFHITGTQTQIGHGQLGGVEKDRQIHCQVAQQSHPQHGRAPRQWKHIEVMILSWSRVEPNVCRELMADLGVCLFQVGFSCDSYGSIREPAKRKQMNRDAFSQSRYRIWFPAWPHRNWKLAIAETVRTYCETSLRDQTKVTGPTPPPTCWRSFRWWHRTQHLGSNLWCTQNKSHHTWPRGSQRAVPLGRIQGANPKPSRTRPCPHCQCDRSKVQESLGVRLHRGQKGNRKEGLSCDNLQFGSWWIATVEENRHDNHDTPFTNWPVNMQMIHDDSFWGPRIVLCCVWARLVIVSWR